jgi:hypothetical protein
MSSFGTSPARSTSRPRVYPGTEPVDAARAASLAADPKRQRLVTQMLAATTEEEIAAARREQKAWLDANPDDFGVLEAGETLAYAEEALLGEQLPAPQ